MKRSLLSILVASSLSASVFASEVFVSEENESSSFGESIFVGTNNSSSDAYVSIQHPGLVHGNQRRRVPGCFFLRTDWGGSSDQLKQFADAVEITYGTKVQEHISSGSSQIFMIRDALSLYVASYKLATKDKSTTLGALFQKIFGNHEGKLEIKFSRGCHERN